MLFRFQRFNFGHKIFVVRLGHIFGVARLLWQEQSTHKQSLHILNLTSSQHEAAFTFVAFVSLVLARS